MARRARCRVASIRETWATSSNKFGRRGFMSGFRFINRTTGRNLLLVTAMALPAAGCSAVYGDQDDYYTPEAHYERFPIGETRAPVNVGVSSAHGQLGPHQAAEVTHI